MRASKSMKRSAERLQPYSKRVKRSELEPEESSRSEATSSSEDELEQIDSNDENSESSDAELLEDSKEAVENKSSKEQHLEQKRLREARKINKPDGATIQQIKYIWERLRVKTGTPADVRKKLIEQIWDLTKDRIKELVLKHDASRVIQTIFKYSDKTKRLTITNALKGSYVDLAKSSYGKYLLVKFLHYGSSEVRESVINELHGNYRKLMKHKEGAYVIEDTYRDYSTALQKKRIIREFYVSEDAIFKDTSLNKSLSEIIAESPDKRPYLMRNLKDVITSAVNKGSIGFTIIHAAMLEYVKNIKPDSLEREEFIDLISEQFAEIVHTNEGSQVACIVLSIATAKERKTLVRSLKPFVTKLATDEYGHLVLITLFNTVDDTVFVSKAFISELKKSICYLIKSKFGRRPLLYILLGRSSRYFSPLVLAKLKEVDDLKRKTSKKDDETRRQELKNAFSPMLLEAIAGNARDLLEVSIGSQFIAEALLYSAGADRTAALEAICDACLGDPLDDNHLIHQAFIGRMLRTLIREGHWNNGAKSVDRIAEPNDFKTLLFNKIKDNLSGWAIGDGSFVVISLLENLKGDEREQITEILRAKKKDISSASTSNKGTRLIESILIAD